MTIVEHGEHGRILSVVTYPTSDPHIQEIEQYKDRLFLAPGYVINQEMDYVVNGEVEARPAMPGTQEGSLLRGIPSGATVSIDGVDYTADGTDIELEFDQQKMYVIRISLWPYLDSEYRYENQAQG